jgi:hypothetical protein
MEIYTTGLIAKELKVDRDKVAYILRKLGVKPAGWAGIVRVYPFEAVATVRAFLDSKGSGDVK